MANSFCKLSNRKKTRRESERGDGDGLELICILFNVFFYLSIVRSALSARRSDSLLRHFLFSFSFNVQLVTINKQKNKRFF